MPAHATDIVVISSHVSRGAVGNRAMAFALERLGFRVWLVPTIILPRHAGHGPVEAISLPDKAFAGHLAALAALPDLANVGAVLSGYLASQAQAKAVAKFVNAVKEAHPNAVYLCDPVIGDDGGLYVDNTIATAVRDILLPLASILTPNSFEAAWLAGHGYDPDGRSPDLPAFPADLGAPVTVVTSQPALISGHIANALIEDGTITLAEHRRIESDAKGTGDLFAALFLGRLMQGHDARTALQMASASVVEVVNVTAQGGGAELDLVTAQRAIVEPRAQIMLRSLRS